MNETSRNMTSSQYMAHIENDSSRISQIAESNPDSGIEFLNGWRVRELVEHLGGVYGFVAANTVAASTEVTPAGDDAKLPPDAQLHTWFLQQRSKLLEALSAVAPSQQAWTFAGIKDAYWWMRRMAHETTVHRFDAESAIEDVTTMDSDLGCDGVREYLEVGLVSSTRRPNRTYPRQSLHLHRTDGEGEWTIQTNDSGLPSVRETHEKGDAAVRGPAAELLLWVWGRPTSEIEVFGDIDVARQWRSLAP